MEIGSVHVAGRRLDVRTAAGDRAAQPLGRMLAVGPEPRRHVDAGVDRMCRRFQVRRPEDRTVTLGSGSLVNRSRQHVIRPLPTTFERSKRKQPSMTGRFWAPPRSWDVEDLAMRRVAAAAAEEQRGQ